MRLNTQNFPSDPTFRPFLVGKLGSTPGVNINYQPGEFDQQDLADSVGRKPYQYIELLPHDTASGGMYYIALYKHNVDPSTYYNNSVTYTIDVQTSTSYICPQDCFSSQNHGTCDSQNLKCDCNTGYFDTDCSVQATLIKVPGKKKLTLPPGEWAYFYLPDRNYKKSFYYGFTEKYSSVYVLYQYSNRSSNILPSANSSALWLDLNASINELWFSDG